MRSPTHWMLTATTTASTEAKSPSVRKAATPRLLANDALIESTRSELNTSAQTRTTARKTKKSEPISSGEMERRSPIRYEEYLLKPPPRLMSMRPSAMPVDENTPMIVSVDALLRFLM